MDYKNHIQNALNHIEANLTAELCTAELARAAGYSQYHFLRIFKQVTRLTPADYIRKRRLSEIAREAMSGCRPISDIAFEYGFNSKENFTRAFKAEYAVLPTEYRAAGITLKSCGPIRLENEAFELTPEITELEGFSLTVLPCAGASPPSFWNRYNCNKLSLKLSGGKSCADYGVTQYIEAGRISYYIGIRTDDAGGSGDILPRTVRLEMPGGLYAVFTTPSASHFDFVNTVHRTWRYIEREWLPRSGYRHFGVYEYETYAEASRAFSEKIYIPIRKKEEETK